MSVGYEHIDLEACKKRGIAVTNTPNVSTDSVSELTVSLLLLVARRLYEGNINREWVISDKDYTNIYLLLLRLARNIRIGWLRIRIMCPRGSTCLPGHC
jgi:lactate dehydrogenase-like 2-hydroxyacid dehydrogenase